MWGVDVEEGVGLVGLLGVDLGLSGCPPVYLSVLKWLGMGWDGFSWGWWLVSRLTIDIRLGEIGLAFCPVLSYPILVLSGLVGMYVDVRYVSWLTSSADCFGPLAAAFA